MTPRTGSAIGTTRSSTAAASVRAVDGDRARDRPDRLVTEEPMEIRVQGPGQEPEPLVVTMRTPGNDFDLAVGFCITEGVIDSAADVATVAYCLPEGDGVQQYNIVTIRLGRPVDLADASPGLHRQCELRAVR